jgi:hypothetical protein
MHKALPPRFTPRLSKSAQGQSLVEFVLVFPILFMLAVAAGSMALGVHQGHVASLAIAQIPLHKVEMAEKEGALGSGDLTGYATGGKFKGPFGSVPAIDSLTVQSVDPYTDLAVATKSFTPLTTFVPGFTMRTAQVINHNLLQAMNTGSGTAHPATDWVPGGTPTPTPW